VAAAASAGEQARVLSAAPHQSGRRGVRVTDLVPHPGLVGVLAAALAGASFIARDNSTAAGAVAALMAVVLTVLAAIDLRHRIIPNRIVLPATLFVLAANIAHAPGRTLTFTLAGIGVALVLLLPNLINRSAIGMGDVKLGLFLGAGLGKSVVGALLIGFTATIPVTVVLLLRGGWAARKTALPLGPFLAFGALIVLIFGH
jgi:leader peptidase (prepilin peptidase)/N-methyltransferase